MTTEAPDAPALSAGELIHAKTTCLVLKVGSFGNTKQVSLGSVQVNADKTLLSMSKRLLDSPELVAIQKFDRELGARIRSMSLGVPIFKGGVYLIPLSLVQQLEDLLKKAIKYRTELVDSACATYQLRIEETTARLQDVANTLDYPPVERFRSAFYLEYSYASFETPSRLKAISAALFDQETAKARKHLASVAEECEQTMRAGLLTLVDHLAARLSPDADGKQKRLNNSTIENLNEFLNVFALKDVTGDTQLAVIVQKAKDVMQGVDHKTLKTDEEVRQKVLDELNALKGTLEPLIVDKGDRTIILED